MPSIENVPLFARNYDDIMEQTRKFVFTNEQCGRVAVFSGGFAVMRSAFNADCLIDSVSSTQLP